MLFRSRIDKTPEPNGEPTGDQEGDDDESGLSGGQGDGDGQEQSDSDQSDSDQGDTEQTGKIQSGNSKQTDQVSAPKLTTVGNLANGFEKLTQSSNKTHDSYEYYDFPRMNLDNIVFPYHKVLNDLAPMRQSTTFCGDHIFAAIEQNNKNFVANLVKQFEQKMAADEARRTRTAKSGRLDLRKIANYKFSDDLFVKNQIVANGKSHGMVFIMDWSGSMGDYLLPTVEQLLALCMFCRKMNIPFEVYAFTCA